MLKKVEETIKKFSLLRCNDRVVIAVSGGPDSVALVYILNTLKREWRLYLHLAHLNHMLRKGEADADRQFVENLAGKLKLPITCESINVSEFSRNTKLSLEEAARKVRYDFLLKVAKRDYAQKIALGHNQDDQAETVLMRFLRGSGISGLRGIPARRKLDNCLIIRPLIEVKRKEILHFLRNKNLSFRTDSSNLKNLYFRNRVRNELLPRLEENFNPNIKEVLVNFAQNISEDFDFLERKGKSKFRAVRSKTTGSKVVINLKKFSSFHTALQKLIVRSAIKELKGNVRSIDYRHWKELESLVGKRPKNSIVDLPGGVSVLKKSEALIFYKRALI